MRMNWMRAAAVAAAIFATAGAARACGTGDILFQDDFSTLEPTWGDPQGEYEVKDHKLVVSPEADYWRTVPSSANLYDDVDLCANVTTIAAVDADHSEVGAVFWYIDSDNFYLAEFAANGNAAVYRRQRARWLQQIPWHSTPLIKQNDGAVNEIRVVTAGNMATISFNGAEFASIKGVPPNDGQQIGFYASSPKDKAASYAFGDFTVRTPESGGGSHSQDNQ